MRKSIINQVLSNLNSNSARAERELAELRASGVRVTAADREEAHLSSKNLTIVTSLLETIEFVKPEAVLWSFENGGDALISSKLVMSAVYTAYTALFWSWVRERGLNAKLVDPKVESPEVCYVPEDGSEEDISVVTFDEACAHAQAVYEYGKHLTRIKDSNDRYPYAWLIAMETETRGVKSVVNILKPFPEWCRDQYINNQRHSEWFKLCGLEAANGSDISEPFWGTMSNEVAFSVMKTWLHEPCNDEVHESRHERIVAKTADRKFFDLCEACLSPRMTSYEVNKHLQKHLSLFELLKASPEFEKETLIYRSSLDYKVRRAERAAQQLEEELEELAETQAALKRLQAAKARKEAALAAIAALEADDEVPEKPEKANVVTFPVVKEVAYDPVAEMAALRAARMVR
jgi:hypothetical protein